MDNFNRNRLFSPPNLFGMRTRGRNYYQNTVQPSAEVMNEADLPPSESSQKEDLTETEENDFSGDDPFEAEGPGEMQEAPEFSPVPKALQGRRGLRAPQAPWDRKESPAHEDRQDRPDTHRTAYLRRFQRKI